MLRFYLREVESSLLSAIDMHHRLGIGYVDSLAAEHVVEGLLSLVEHCPIVVRLHPDAHYEVDAAICQCVDAHKGTSLVGRLEYALI